MAKSTQKNAAELFELTDRFPLPRRRRKIENYPFDNMKPGLSFFVPTEAGVGTPPVIFAVRRWQKTHPGYEFTTSRVEEEGKVGTRVWMVSAPEPKR